MSTRARPGRCFLASVRGGGMLGGANRVQLDALTEYGRALGVAFQVIDDHLDVEASAEQMGKRTHKDNAHGKATYPALIGARKVARLRARPQTARDRSRTGSMNAPNRCVSWPPS